MPSNPEGRGAPTLEQLIDELRWLALRARFSGLVEVVNDRTRHIEAALRAHAAEPSPLTPDFQARVHEWMLACFGEVIASDRTERNHRFLEESLELVQSLGCTQGEAHQLVDYVYGRPVGEPDQEMGGVMVTLAALGTAAGLQVDTAADRELARVWTKIEKIRAKQAAKPKHSPLPASARPVPEPPRTEGYTECGASHQSGQSCRRDRGHIGQHESGDYTWPSLEVGRSESPAPPPLDLEPIKARHEKGIFMSDSARHHKAHADRGALIAEVERLRAARQGRPSETTPEPKICVHGHKAYTVGCVSCVLLHHEEPPHRETGR